MNKDRLFTYIIFALVALSAAAINFNSCCALESAYDAASAAMKGEVTESQVDGFTVYIFVPSDYNRMHKYPLIIGAHGASQTGMEIIKSWEKTADERGYIVAAPTVSGQADQDKIAAEKVFIDIVKTVESKYNINKDKVIMTGNSMGAGYTYSIGLKHPEIFAAVAPSSGSAGALKGFPWKSGLKKIPVFIMHGDSDRILPPENAYQAKIILEHYGYRVKMYIGEGAGHGYPDISLTPIPDWIDNNFN